MINKNKKGRGKTCTVRPLTCDKKGPMRDAWSGGGCDALRKLGAGSRNPREGGKGIQTQNQLSGFPGTFLVPPPPLACPTAPNVLGALHPIDVSITLLVSRPSTLGRFCIPAPNGSKRTNSVASEVKPPHLIMQAFQLCMPLVIGHPPSREATLLQLCTPNFHGKYKENPFLAQKKYPPIMHPPAGEAASLQLCRCKLIWGVYGTKRIDPTSNASVISLITDVGMFSAVWGEFLLSME